MKNFKDICSNSKNLTLEEITGVEKLHNSITKTKLVFSLTKENTTFERQEQLFKLYESAANEEITADRFELLDSLVLRLKKEKKFKYKVVILDVIKNVIKARQNVTAILFVTFTPRGVSPKRFKNQTKKNTVNK